jgi:hypothetical protein
MLSPWRRLRALAVLLLGNTSLLHACKHDPLLMHHLGDGTGSAVAAAKY